MASNNHNKYKPVGRGDYGVRVARNGFDAQTAGDSNLLFNSGWRIIQIVKVIDMSRIVHDDNPPVYPVPDGWTIDRTNWGGAGVWNWNCCVDEKWFYLPGYSVELRTDPNGQQHRYCQGDKVYHGLGYVPLFFKSEFVSDTPGYILLTNIDIRQDADYPYTSKPSYYDGNTKNYGIKSKSYTRAKMPQPGETRGCGINTSIQSKLVMAVKTELTTIGKPSTENPRFLDFPTVAWSVPEDSNSKTTTLADYEAFGFWSPDGQIFQEYPIGFRGTGEGSFYTLIDQWGAAVDRTKSALVIIRSPLVAPDIEEITIQ